MLKCLKLMCYGTLFQHLSYMLQVGDSLFQAVPRKRYWHDAHTTLGA